MQQEVDLFGVINVNVKKEQGLHFWDIYVNDERSSCCWMYTHFYTARGTRFKDYKC